MMMIGLLQGQVTKWIDDVTIKQKDKVKVIVFEGTDTDSDTDSKRSDSNNDENSTAEIKTVNEIETEIKTKAGKNMNYNKNDDLRNVLPARTRSRSRPLLIFNHNPKAGGGSILNVLQGFKSNKLVCNENRGCNSNVWDTIHRYQNQDKDDDNNNNSNNKSIHSINNTFLSVSEFSRTTLSDKQNGYIIGSIREPCSQYLSLWSFASLGRGTFRKLVLRNEQLYGESPPFNTQSDIQRFHKWMKHPKVVGIIGKRVKNSYGYGGRNKSNIVDNIDCWVFVENFQQSLFHCLEQYEKQGGYVDWESKILSQLKYDVLEQEKQQQQNNNQNQNNGRNLYNETKRISKSNLNNKKLNRKSKDPTQKNDPLGDPRTHHHAPCRDFFFSSESTNRNNINNTGFDLIRQTVLDSKNELFIYQQFGYEGCCIPGNHYLGYHYKQQQQQQQQQQTKPETRNRELTSNSNSEGGGGGGGGGGSSGIRKAIYATSEQAVVVATFIILILLITYFVCHYRKRRRQRYELGRGEEGRKKCCFPSKKNINVNDLIMSGDTLRTNTSTYCDQPPPLPLS